MNKNYVRCRYCDNDFYIESLKEYIICKQNNKINRKEYKFNCPICNNQSISHIFNDDNSYKNKISKTLKNTNSKNVKENVFDVKIIGNPDLWICIGKAWSEKEKWMKSTKVMEIRGSGCLIQVTTQENNNISEALTFIPNVKLVQDNKENYKIVKN